MHSLSVVRFALLLAAAGPALASSAVLRLDASPTRSPDQLSAQVDAALQRFAQNAVTLTRAERRARKIPAWSPATTVLVQRGNTRSRGGRGGGPITLQFATSGNRQFPSDYQILLQDVFARVRPRLDAVFGAPVIGGPVRVSNWDVDLGERDAVIGGAFVYDSATGDQEIRFPIYADAGGLKPEVAAVQFVHALLLAYRGNRPLPNDGWNEGLVRAAVLQICRTAGALPNALDPDLIEQQLAATYDTSPTYDWSNQRALSGPIFIAPNLRNQPLPPGGSVGGLYLLRYQMAGTAMQKVLTEYPNFAAEFLRRYDLASGSPDLDALAQTSIDALGGSGSTVEGQTFAEWSRRQFILNAALTPGNKLLVQPFAITSGLAGPDFGVFGIQTHWFRTESNGNEALLRDTAYPIYWSPDYSRFFTAAQDDRITIGAGYGAVAPNFPSGAFGGEPYRVTVDIPVRNQIARAYLPAGAIATATRPTPNTLYGVVVGTDPGSQYRVRVRWGALLSATANVTNGAFGILLEGDFERSQARVEVDVIRVQDGETVVSTRRLNKGPGPIGLVLGIDADRNENLDLAAGISMTGFLGEPYVVNPRSIWGAGTLAARWEPIDSRWNYEPGGLGMGQAAFVRRDAASQPTYSTFAPPNTPASVALQPGWNLIVNPLDVAVNRDDVQVVVASEFPRSFADAAAEGLIAPDWYLFSPNSPDPASGVAERGSYISDAQLLPGQAAFIKCLSATGATLRLPTNSASRTRSSVPGWPMRVTARAETGRAVAHIGGRAGASSRLDPGLDSELPASMGGLQLASAPGRLGRDVRAIGRSQVYFLRLEGIAPKQKVDLELQVTQGGVRSYQISAPGLLRRSFTRSSNLSFVARSRNPVIRITVQGGRP